MQSDPMWSCAMAVNVYLVFFRRYDAHRLKKLYWVYGLICYGLPFIPALFCLIYKTKVKGKMYGNATVRTCNQSLHLRTLLITYCIQLWCWIDNDWAAIRIYSYYAPIWVAILAALIIYVRVGVEIFQKRSQLRALSGAADGTMTSTSHPEPAFTGLRTTEIEVVTTEPWAKSPVKTAPEPYPKRDGEKPGAAAGAVAGRDQYTITISAHDSRPPPPAPRTAGTLFRLQLPRRPSSMDRVKWAYTKCAMLFAVSILITWVPASVNRVYGLRYPKSPSFALNICSAIVLPLQGFWNTVIYFTTSLSICRGVFARFRSREKQARGTSGFTVLEEGERRQRKTESTIELSHSRSLGSLSDSV